MTYVVSVSLKVTLRRLTSVSGPPLSLTFFHVHRSALDLFGGGVRSSSAVSDSRQGVWGEFQASARSASCSAGSQVCLPVGLAACQLARSACSVRPRWAGRKCCRRQVKSTRTWHLAAPAAAPRPTGISAAAAQAAEDGWGRLLCNVDLIDCVADDMSQFWQFISWLIFLQQNISCDESH